MSERSHVPVGVQIRILEGIFGLHVVCRNGSCHTEEPLIVSPHQGLERLVIPPCHTRGELVIPIRVRLEAP